MRLTQQDKRCDWIAPSNIVIRLSPKGEEPKLEIVSDFWKINMMIRKKPNPTVKTHEADILDSTQIFAELGLKSLAQQLPIH